MPNQFDGWIQARVGCHWTRGEFHASTITTGDHSRSGYVLMRNRERLAEFVPWSEVQRIVRKHGLTSVITPSEPPSIKRLIDQREDDVRSGRLASDV